MQPFIHLHVHSQYSILDGQASIPALVDKAIRDGMKGLALTDHGNMFGIKEFFNLVKKKNGATKDAIKGVQKRIEAIESGAEEVEDKKKELASLQEEKAKLEAKIFKPIFGCEMYVARRRLTDKEATPREIRTTVVNEVEGFSIRRGAVDEGGYHLVVLAKNLKGYHNLVKLVSKGWTDWILFPSPYRQIRTRKISRRADCLLCMSGWRDFREESLPAIFKEPRKLSYGSRISSEKIITSNYNATKLPYREPTTKHIRCNK